MLKKITLLAMAVAAFAALAAPSMASADQWYTNEELLGGFTERDSVHFTGTLSATKAGLKISCTATANVSLWNETEGTGQIDELTISPNPVETPGCTIAIATAGGYVDIPGCHITYAAPENFPWHINLKEGNGIEIENLQFTNEFNGCFEPLGIPNGTKIQTGGTVTGVSNGGNCIIFSENGHVPEVRYDGGLCATSGELELK